MKKGLTIALTIASVFLIAGAVASRFDAVWAEASGLFGLLVVVFCLGIVVAAWAMEEIDKGRCR